MKSNEFKIGDKVVYPSHKSIGSIIEISKEKIADTEVTFYKIEFQKDNMVLHVPVNAAIESGLRVLNSKNYISEHVIPVLREPSSKKDETWRNCSGEYEAKLNSGDLSLVAEIIRDLCDNGNFTYSKRNIYDSALDRLTSEVSSVYGISYESVKKRLLMIRNGLARTIEESVGSSDKEIEKDLEKETLS
ncbi:MAG: CarD family transcriptional regulator [Rickettsiaceae bacterium H1]|nr:CarD family transcriptional regulator [Rickettsiaceae bacterium H1]